MRNIAPVLCAVMMVGTSVLGGCSKPEPKVAPPPPVKAEKVEKAAEPAKPKPTLNFEMDKSGALKLPGPVVFETGSDKLKPESDEVLDVVKAYLDAKPKVTLLRIEGHTDADGKKENNQTLSEKRAISVARWLVTRGIACGRLIPVGFGQDKPIADNATADGKAQNRRTSFVNAGLDGKPIGGMPVDGGGRVAGDPCR